MDFLMNLIQLGLDAGILALCCEVVFRQKAEIKAKDFFVFPILLVLCVVPRVDFSIGANMTASFRSEGFEILPADNIVGLLFLIFAVLLLSSIFFGSKSSGTVFCGTMAAFSVFLFVKCLCVVLFAVCGATDILLLLGSRAAALCLIVVLEFTPLFGLIHQLVQRSDFTILIVSTNIAVLLMTVLSILSFDVDIAAYYSYELMTKRNILILLAVVVGITLYKGLGYGAAESDAEWIYSLFAGHGTGYFQVFPFLEMLITSGVPLYLLAAFVEHTVNGQSIFISVRAKSRRHLVKGILSVSTKFLIIYAFFWLMAGLIGASLFSTGLTIVSFRLMLYAVLMKCLDILVQYLIVLGIYIATRQVTIGFLVLVAGNLLCILPGNWVAYSPFGLSSLTRISVVEPGIGISAVSAFGIEAAILTLMIAGILMWGYKKILN